MPYKDPAVRRRKQAEYNAAHKERLAALRKARHQENRERALEAMKVYYAENRASVRAKQQGYYQQNTDAFRAKQARWLAANPNRRAEAYKKNPSPIRAVSSRRRAALLQRTVAWDQELTDLVAAEAHDLAVMRERVTGFAWHVDHEIPLRGRHVSGLHVWNNFQVIPGAENVRKRNHFTVQP